jgi:hypothetical protein
MCDHTIPGYACNRAGYHRVNHEYHNGTGLFVIWRSN